jgi:murein DD-endopeptidase MepM/ murein hydrolase activator NlpD
MKDLRELTPADWRAQARTFGLGALAGFIAGACLVSVIIWRPGVVMGAPSGDHRSPTTFLDDSGPAVLDLVEQKPAATTGRTAPAVESTAGGPAAAIGPSAGSPGELEDRDLQMPVEGVGPESLTRQFDDPRGASRRHEAIDILAPRNTPVKAVEDGSIARLFHSRAGGLTIYQFDPTERFCYYYAHLERYANGLKEGDRVTKGQVIGYVGSSGNAPKDTPHLHFAIFRLTDTKRWWEGVPIDPFDVLR